MPSAGADVGTFSQQTPGPAQSWDNIPRIQSQIPSTILCSTASQRSRIDTLEARLAGPFPGFPRAMYRVAASPAPLLTTQEWRRRLRTHRQRSRQQAPGVQGIILELARMTQTHDLAVRPGVAQLSTFAELQQSLPSRVSAISPFVDQLMQFLRPLIHKFRSEDQDELDIEIAVREAIANAVVHGNHEDPRSA
jgi:hypothetical protein